MKLSVLIPVYNEELCIDPIYTRVRKTLDALPGLDSWEVVFLNNASQDNSLKEILKLRAREPRVKVVTLARNFGYHGSLTAGLTTIESDLYALVDGDGEDPPEVFAQFYEKIQQGVQVVYGIRSQRDEPGIVTLFRGLFYHINQWIADSATVLWMGEFVMLTRQVRDALLVTRSTFPFLRTEIAHVGFERIGIPYQRGKRMFGKTHYNPYQMVKFAAAGFLSSSTFPLRFVLYLSSILGLLLPLAALALHLSLDQIAQVSAILLFYFMMVTCSILALYLARTYKNSVARPFFVVDQRLTHL